MDGIIEIYRRIFLLFTKLRKLPEIATNAKLANDKVKGVILEIFYIRSRINLTNLLNFYKDFLT